VPGKTALVGLLLSGQAVAWSGITATVGEYDEVWRIGGVARPVTLGRYGLAVEDRTAVGLRLGLAVGEFALRIENRDAAQFDDYVGQYVDLRLRWPLELGSVLSVHGDFAYSWQSGIPSAEGGDTDGIDWSRTRFGLGLQLRLGVIGLRPFFEWRSLEGGADVAGARQLFENDSRTSAGLVVDIEVEPSGFVRFTWLGEGRTGLMLSFVRAY